MFTSTPHIHHHPFQHHLLFYFLLLVSFHPGISQASVQVTPITKGLHHPWSMVFLPNKEILVSERRGQLRRIVNNQLLDNPVTGLPNIQQVGQGGLMGLALHPNFTENHWLYFAYAGQDHQGYSTHLARGRYHDGQLTDVQHLFSATPKSNSTHHFGGRVVFDKRHYLYLVLGDRGQRHDSQDLSNHSGSVIRLHDDGKIPQDNPFVNTTSAMPEIYSYGHRNQQGAAIDPQSDQLWTHEHGPQGGDELNIIKPGANYGWPVISYGEEYGGGSVGNGLTKKAGLEQPIHYWKPSIAPSGMTFVTSDKYPQWQGGILVAALKNQLLSWLTLQNNQVTNETHFLVGKVGRIRDVKQAPDRYIYILTDSVNGGLYRIETSR